MEAEINRAIVKALNYKAGTKEEDPDAIGRLVLEFDADEADPSELARLMNHPVTVTLSSPQMAMSLVDVRTGEIG